MRFLFQAAQEVLRRSADGSGDYGRGMPAACGGERDTTTAAAAARAAAATEYLHRSLDKIQLTSYKTYS